MVDEISVVPEDDSVDIIRGVGGVEYVCVKIFLKIEIGNMDYSLEVPTFWGLIS